MNYGYLDPAEIKITLEKLRFRINERFPDSGLYKISGECLSLVQEASQRASWVKKANIPLRVFVGTLLIILLLLAADMLLPLNLNPHSDKLSEFFQMLEAGANIALLLGGALYFLCTYEQRIKRERVLRTVHSIRSLAHIIDMHQLTKDPSRLSDSFKTTTSSPVVDYTALELQRYLDYCSELLAILGKVAALYAQHLYDPVVLDAVDDIEGLTNGMSSKIWQKIIMLERP